MTDHLPRRFLRARPTTAPTEVGRPGRAVGAVASLVASARRLVVRRVGRKTVEDWQDEAWEMYDEVGELRFVAGVVATACSRARLVAATVEPGADPTPLSGDELTAEEQIVAHIVHAIGGSIVGQQELLRQTALHLFVPGDGLLVGLPPGTIDRGSATRPALDPRQADGDVDVTLLDWYAMSQQEVRFSGGEVEIDGGDGQKLRLDDDRCVIIRVWRPHPRRWWQADSPVRSSLPVLRELVGLTKHVAAQIDSQLAGAGLLVLPNSVDVVGRIVDPDDPDAEPDFVDALADAMLTPIEDRGSAASVVPLTIRVPDEAVDKVKHLRFSVPLDEQAKELRDEAIRRLALGLDVPAETLLGLSVANHWTAWLLDEERARIHIEPVLGLVCDAWTSQYLWPACEAAGIDDPRRFVVWRDMSGLVQKADRTADATVGHERGLLSDEAWRRLAGFDEADAPGTSTIDPAIELALQVVGQAPSLLANPGLASIVQQIRETAAAGEDFGPDAATSEADDGHRPPEPPDELA